MSKIFDNVRNIKFLKQKNINSTLLLLLFFVFVILFGIVDKTINKNTEDILVVSAQIDSLNYALDDIEDKDSILYIMQTNHNDLRNILNNLNEENKKQNELIFQCLENNEELFALFENNSEFNEQEVKFSVSVIGLNDNKTTTNYLSRFKVVSVDKLDTIIYYKGVVQSFIESIDSGKYLVLDVRENDSFPELLDVDIQNIRNKN